MSEISSDGMADNGELGVEPRAAMIIAEGFQAQEGAQGQANVVALGTRQASLRLFEAAELFDAAMIGFDVPGILGQAQAGEFVQSQVVGGPVFNVAVCGNDLE